MVHPKHILSVVHDSTPSSPSIVVSVMPGALATCALPSPTASGASASALVGGACAADSAAVVAGGDPSSSSTVVSAVPGMFAICASPSPAAPDASASAAALMAGACAALPKHAHLPVWGDRPRPLAARARLPPPPLGRRRRRRGPQPWLCPPPRGRRRPVPCSRRTRRSSCAHRPGRSAAPP